MYMKLYAQSDGPGIETWVHILIIENKDTLDYKGMPLKARKYL